MARSFIKLYGPSICKGYKALEKVEVEMSKKTTMKFYSAAIPHIDMSGMSSELESDVAGFFIGDLSEKETINLISRTSQVLGDFDFFFEWGTDPTVKQVNELIEMIDEAILDSGCRYTITTK